MFKKIIFLLFVLSLLQTLSAQKTVIYGTVKDSLQNPIENIFIFCNEINQSTSTDRKGNFTLEINNPRIEKISLSLSHISFQKYDTIIEKRNFDKSLEIKLKAQLQELTKVEIRGEKIENEKQNVYEIAVESAKNIPSPFSDFNKVLVVLPGVTSNNELSSAYSVRGGNFNENLVYVNGIPVYRPFLSSSGQQEGLSFVNPSLVDDIKFYAGGWEAKYGDKLSSSLNITYREPQEFSAEAEAGFLGGQANVGGITPNQKMSYLFGVRHRNSKYILNSLEVQGQYFPKFTDFQSMFTFDLTPSTFTQKNKLKLNWLLAYSNNDYLTYPTSQTTEFGTISQTLRLKTAFEGSESLIYNTLQSGISLNYFISERFKTQLIVSGVYTSENENFEVEGAYRLCDVINSPFATTIEECSSNRSIGTYFKYGRNTLDAVITTIENRNEIFVNDYHKIEWGLGFIKENISDHINEYSFQDSADFVKINHLLNNELEVDNENYFGYTQYQWVSFNNQHQINLGLRLNFKQQSEQLLISPRFLYRYKPHWSNSTFINFSVGHYSQHAFYRELRNENGEINLKQKAQESYHFILGIDKYLTLWGNPFSFTIQSYYKYINTLIPYEIDNLKIRYFSNNIAFGYVYGIDMRFNGSFIKDTQSWFSLGLLRAQENIENDNRGDIRSPLDQWVNLGVFFEDHIPNDPTVRVFVNLNIGSGYPFGPPGDAKLRNSFSGDEYYRLDLGFSKIFMFQNNKFMKSISLKLEVLNALGVQNTLSYSWIKDVNGFSFAIPNNLSQRFYNFKVKANF